MNKPASMTLKEWLIKKMAINMVIPEKVIDVVISHQFDSAHNALGLHDSVEISGFGKFYFNKKKALKHFEKLTKIKDAYIKMLEDDSLSKEKRKNTQTRLDNILVDIKYLKPKINETTGDI